MPRIEIETPAADGVLPSFGTVLKLNGHEVPDVRSIYLALDVNNVVTATIEVIATERFSFTAGVDLHVNAIVLPGYRLLADQTPDGGIAYRAEKDVP